MLKLLYIRVIIIFLCCFGIYFVISVMQLGIMVLRLRLVRKCISVNCVGFCVMVLVRLNSVNSVIDQSKICFWLQWLESGFVIRVLMVMLNMVVLRIGFILVWLMFQFLMSVGVIKFIIVVLYLFSIMMMKQSSSMFY